MSSPCMLVAMTIGVKLIKCAVSKQSSQLPTLLASALPDFVQIVLDDKVGAVVTKEIPLALLRAGDTIKVQANATFPGDCVITEGKTSVLQTIINGELDPVAINVGDIVQAGSTNRGASVVARVIKAGQDTWLGSTLRALSKANANKSELQIYSDRFLDWFSIAVSGLALGLAIDQWLNGATPGEMLDRTAAILLCACPCTMGMGIPVCLMAATRESLESHDRIRTKVMHRKRVWKQSSPGRWSHGGGCSSIADRRI